MSDTDENKNKKFNWTQGETLSEDNFDPIKEVRAKGLPKLKDAVHSDPKKRKDERDTFITKSQSKSYTSSKNKKVKDDQIIAEESQSGLSESDKFKSEEAKRLIDKGSKIKGIDRFGKK